MMSATSNWRTSPVREFCLDVGTIDPSKTPDREFAYIDIASIDRVQKRITAPQTVLGADAPSRARQLVNENDVLVSTVRPNLNAVAQIPSSLDRQVASTGFCVLRPDTRKIHPRLVYYWVQTPPFVEGLMTRVRGANYPAVRDVDVLESAISTSDDIHEQARIVELLDQADALRRKRADADAKLARLLPALFRHHFGEENAFPTAPLTEFAETTSGGTPDRKESKYFGGKIPWVKSGELSQIEITRTEETITEEALLNSSAKLMPPGTILLAMYGATVGLVARLNIAAATNQAVCCISPRQGVDSDFLFAALRINAPNLIHQRVGGAQPNVSQGIVRQLHLPQASPAVQILIGKQAVAASQLQTQAAASAAKLETLFQTLLHRAFTGELTAKWREAHLREGVQELARVARA